MSTKRNTTSATNAMSTPFRHRSGRAPLALLGMLALALTVPARAETRPAAIPFSDIGARATANYQGDALGITATADGARLGCGFQKLEGQATPEGLWLESTKPGAAGRLRLTAAALARVGLSTLNPQPSTTLPTTGEVSVNNKLVRFTRPGLTEEYSVSADGVRQDFIIVSPPLNAQRSTLNQSAGDLRVELALSGARAEAAAGGAKLRLDGSGRVLAYSRLRVEDAMGRELTARLEVLSADRLAVNVADANATYPVRIDPTFSDAQWVSLNPGIPGANGDIWAIAVDGNGNVYVGGTFTWIGTVMAKDIAKWDGSAWSALGSGMNNVVMALAVSGTDLYAGGQFTTAGGVPANYIAKWNGSAWSALGSGMDSYVGSLAVSGTDLYAGGRFSTAGGVTANYIAKWNGSAWSALGSGIMRTMDNNICALAVSGTDLYVGGYFSTAGGVTVNNIAKWNGSAWLPLGSGMVNGWVSALAVSGTNLYAGGQFTTAGGVPANYIARWDGTAWSALGSGMSGGLYPAFNVVALAVSGPYLYAAGGFTNAGGVTANCIARWNGSAWSASGSGVSGCQEYTSVKALAVGGTNLYAGGHFTTSGEVPANYIAKWDGTTWSALGSGLNSEVVALAVNGTDLYATGQFPSGSGGYPANYVVKWNGSGWSVLGSGMNIYVGGRTVSGRVTALAVSGNDLYAGGQFTTAGGVPANNVAKWNGRAWTALGSGITNGLGYTDVNALVVSGTDLYVGGSFTTAGGVPANNIAKWDGSTWSALGSGMPLTGDINALAVSGTNLYAGGRFTTAGGVRAIYIAKWDGSAWSALGSGMGSYVGSLAVSGTNLYAGGDFTTAGGVPANGIAKWDGSAWSALGSGIRGDNNNAYVLAVSGTDLYAGGSFTTAGGVPATNIAKWNGSAWSALGEGVSAGQAGWGVWALAADGAGHLFVGGAFTLAGTNASPYIAEAILVPSVPTILKPPQTQTAEAGATVRLTVEGAGEPQPAYQWYFNGTNLLSCASSDLVLTNISLSRSGTYTVVVTNVFGSVTSAPIVLNVIPPVARRLVAGVNLMAQPGNFLGLDYRDNLGPAASWATMATMTLSNTSQFYFDVSEPPPLQRFYRAWQTGTPGVRPSLDLHLVPAITLTGDVGDSVRLDYINQFGPIDAWVTLDMVILTNTSQLCFDVSAPGQPPRLYRLVPLP